jgi:phospholipase C
VAGDSFGMENDGFHAIPSNVSTIVDLLDTKGISWAEYQEGSPYAGFEGFNYSNQKTFANDYVRKHNPLILFESVTSNATRLELIKNFTSFADDLKNNALPQWAFVSCCLLPTPHYMLILSLRLPQTCQTMVMTQTSHLPPHGSDHGLHHSSIIAIS